uniref:Uncharacterized protein n=1 Tax=Chenopodium quinoa TaxID=63459 RepID=A0A803MSS2_CHEQI
MESLLGQLLNMAEESLRTLHFPKGSLHLLRTLSLQNVGCSADLVECLPCLDFPLPSSLSQLTIKSFRYLKTIANGNTLPNLTDLVSDCPKLESLVSDFTSLTELSLENCPKFCNFTARFIMSQTLGSIETSKDIICENQPPRIRAYLSKDADLSSQRASVNELLYRQLAFQELT